MITNSVTAAATPTPAPAVTKPADPLAGKNVFLQLLVAQLKNQDPSNPADGLQFVTQLAQFTTLEQSTAMRDDLHAIRETLEAQAAAATSRVPSTNS